MTVALLCTSVNTAVGAAPSLPKPSGSVGLATDTAVPNVAEHFSFVNQAGNPVTLARFKGKTIFMVPLLTLCPDTCPFTSGNVRQLQQRVAAAGAGSRVQFVFFDVDPYRDTPARLRSYAKLVGLTQSDVTFLTLGRAPAPAAGSPTVHHADAAYPVENPVANFFQFQTQKQAEPNPAMVDWMSPYRPLTYDISHSDGFYVVDPRGVLRFVSGNPPHFVGSLNPTLTAFLSADGHYVLTHPYTPGWKPSDAEAALSWVIGKKI